MGDRDGTEKQTAAMILAAARIVPEQQEPQMILTAQQTGSLPVYALGGSGHRYRIGDDGRALTALIPGFEAGETVSSFDVRALAALLPGFEAGKTTQEHGSLILMAICQLLRQAKWKECGP